MEKKLKPRPFCGKRSVQMDKVYGYYCDAVIYCENCDTALLLDDVNATEEQLVEAWNRRADSGKLKKPRGH